MRAVLLDGPGDAGRLRFGEAEAPEPGPGQILIRVAATSVNRPDLLQREGRYPPPPGASEILGLEAAGTVAALGAEVGGFDIGERVMALLTGGGYAEYAVAETSHTLRIPDALSFEQAACICETYITAYMNLFLGAALADGETVLIHGGAGGVGTAALQLCTALAPRSRLFTTASGAAADRIAALAAATAIDYRQQDFSAIVLEETGGRGADVILDHIGARYLTANLRSLAVDGRLALIGVMGGAKAEINLGFLLVRRQRLIGSVLRSRPTGQKAAIIQRFGDTVLPLFAAGRIVPVIERVWPLSEVAEAHRAMERGGHFGKLVLKVM
jgi:NADPH:quinone reductase